MQSHIRKVYTCLAVTCLLHFWQNDRDLLCAAAVTRGWNGYRNKSQHRKSTQEKKILLTLLQGFEPATFQSWVRRSNHWAIPAPNYRVFMLHGTALSSAFHCGRHMALVTALLKTWGQRTNKNLQEQCWCKPVNWQEPSGATLMQARELTRTFRSNADASQWIC